MTAYAPPKVTASTAAQRRYALKDILNSNLLAPEARKEIERQYAETGEILERAVKAAS